MGGSPSCTNVRRAGEICRHSCARAGGWTERERGGGIREGAEPAGGGSGSEWHGARATHRERCPGHRVQHKEARADRDCQAERKRKRGKGAVAGSDLGRKRKTNPNIHHRPLLTCRGACADYRTRTIRLGGAGCDERCVHVRYNGRITACDQSARWQGEISAQAKWGFGAGQVGRRGAG